MPNLESWFWDIGLGILFLASGVGNATQLCQSFWQLWFQWCGNDSQPLKIWCKMHTEFSVAIAPESAGKALF